MHPLRVGGLILVAAHAVSCGGGTPTTPGPTTIAAVAGTWEGRMRTLTMQGQCASDLAFLVGSDAPLSLRLVQAGATVSGTLDVGSGTCEVAGTAGATTVQLTTTSCAPRPQTIHFILCADTGSEMVVRSLTLGMAVNTSAATGTYAFARDIRIPAGGGIAGVLTEAGDVALNRR